MPTEFSTASLDALAVKARAIGLVSIKPAVVDGREVYFATIPLDAFRAMRRRMPKAMFRDAEGISIDHPLRRARVRSSRGFYVTRAALRN